MTDDDAAQLVGVAFEDQFKTTVDLQACENFDQEVQEWSGMVEGFRWEICVDSDKFLLDIYADYEGSKRLITIGDHGSMKKQC